MNIMNFYQNLTMHQEYTVYWRFIGSDSEIQRLISEFVKSESQTSGESDQAIFHYIPGLQASLQHSLHPPPPATYTEFIKIYSTCIHKIYFNKLCCYHAIFQRIWAIKFNRTLRILLLRLWTINRHFIIMYITIFGCYIIFLVIFTCRKQTCHKFANVMAVQLI